MKVAISINPEHDGVCLEDLIIFAVRDEDRHALIHSVPEKSIIRYCHLLGNPKRRLSLTRLCMDYIRWHCNRRLKQTPKEEYFTSDGCKAGSAF